MIGNRVDMMLAVEILQGVQGVGYHEINITPKWAISN